MERYPWMLRPSPQPDPPVRLLWLHHAGGSATRYHTWHRQFPKNWDLCFLEAPGRGINRQPPLDSLAQLADYFSAHLEPYLNAPIALFGHSMGAWVAFELAQLLLGRGANVVWLGVSGRKAPYMADTTLEHGLHTASDHVLLQHLRSMGGTPEEILAMPDMMEYVLGVIRADYKMVETYHSTRVGKLSCAISAFGGTEDTLAGRNSLAGWQQHTTRTLLLRQWPGGHFYLYDRENEVCAAIAEQIIIALRGRSPE